MIRLAKEDELQRINEIRKQINDVHVDGRPDRFRDGFNEELQSQVYDQYHAPNKDIIVAERDGEICGIACVEYVLKPQSPYSLERKIYVVNEFGVDEAHRRKGVATELIDFIRKDAKEKEFEHIELDVWEFNESARAFYESVGFKVYRRYMELAN